MENKLFIIIQARMTSTRLPKKVMLPLCGKSALEIMINRIEKFKDNIIIATTNDGTEEDIVKLAKKLNVKYYQGDTDNVLSRYYESAIKFGATDNDVIVRLTSDCPIMDQEILSQIIESFKTCKCDYLSNVIERTYPRGMDTEVFRFKSLKMAYENATTSLETEHVTPYINNTNKDKFILKSYKDIENNSKYRLTLDEIDDYEAIKEVYKKFDDKINFSYSQLITTLKDNPYIYDINSHVEQKKK
jgi:spore coat polysaccharide biosynthesis protein SpsF